MRDDDVGPSRLDQGPQGTTGTEDGPGPSEPSRAESVDRHSRVMQLVGDPPRIAEGKFLVEPRREPAMMGQGREQGLGPAVEIARVAVKDADGPGRRRVDSHGDVTMIEPIGKAAGSPRTRR